MAKGEAAGVEHLTGGFEPRILREAGVRSRSIDGVADEGKSEVEKMDPHLVGSSRMDLRLDKRGPGQAFQKSKGGPGIPPIPFRNRHLFSLHRMPPYAGANLSLGRLETAAHQAVVDLFHLPCRKRILERSMGQVILGHD